MSTAANQPIRTESLPSLEALNTVDIPNNNQSPKNLTDAFPPDLVNTIGRGYLEKIPEVYGIKKVSFDLVPESGAIKGTDELGRLFVAFVVRNPNYKDVQSDYKWGAEEGYPVEEMIITLIQETSATTSLLQALFDIPMHDTNSYTFQRYYQKDISGMSRNQVERFGYFGRLSHLTHLPTNDPRLLSAHPLGKDQYGAIREIFEGRHKDLRLVNLFSQSVEDKLRRKEQELGPWMERPKVEAILDAYRKELESPQQQPPAAQKV